MSLKASERPLKIAIVAGEISGDILGARLIDSLQKLYPYATFEGIAGAEMQQAGCMSLYPMETLSVMGYVEVLSRLPTLLKIRKGLIQRWKANPPDLMIGIDAPDFNLKIEKVLYQAGITTAHYVSPSIWAWKEGRVKKMQGAMDLMLTLFPFEVDFYKKHNVPAEFVGHPLADEIPLEPDQLSARKQLGLNQEGFILAILPGSRQGEISKLGPDFIKGAEALFKKHPDWQFVVPMVTKQLQQQIEDLKKGLAPDLPITYTQGQSRLVMEAADQILMASGTAVLEGMLVGRPMVAAYRVAPFTARIIRLFKLIKSKYFTLPNNLADEYLVPELIQEELTPENIVLEVEKQFKQSTQQQQKILSRFKEIHLELKQNASQRAALALYNLIETKRKNNNG
ncbi:MAG: lipid-A-disaccharide synthase [Cocleimonas sp.]|nr:lipid-A-disaccharide synthase [Cocleimonas sp.]